MEYVTEKWGGRPHKSGHVHLLGEDEHGVWLWGPSGRTIWRGQEPIFTTEQDALILIVDGAWWSAGWWEDHPDVALYVDVGTPPARTPDRLTSVDLDLDVARFCDGRVEILDRDEFELHQVELAYPSEIVAAAERAAAEVLSLVTRNAAPFDGIAASRWFEHARAAELPPLDG